MTRLVGDVPDGVPYGDDGRPPASLHAPDTDTTAARQRTFPKTETSRASFRVHPAGRGRGAGATPEALDASGLRSGEPVWEAGGRSRGRRANPHRRAGLILGLAVLGSFTGGAVAGFTLARVTDRGGGDSWDAVAPYGSLGPWWGPEEPSPVREWSATL